MNILVADDDGTIRAVLSELLVDDGHVVVTACDGPSTLAALRSAAPHVALIDVRMPGLQADTFARAWADACPPDGVAFIAVSALAELPEPLRPLVCAHLRKPFDIDTVLAAVHHHGQS